MGIAPVLASLQYGSIETIDTYKGHPDGQLGSNMDLVFIWSMGKTYKCSLCIYPGILYVLLSSCTS